MAHLDQSDNIDGATRSTSCRLWRGSARYGASVTGIIDAHVHLEIAGLTLRPEKTHGYADYRQSVHGLGIERMAALVIAQPGNLSDTAAMNDTVLGLQRERPETFPLCSVHPSDKEDALAEIDRVAGCDAAGLKLHPNTQRLDVSSPDVLAVVQRAGEHDLPVLFDSIAVDDPGQPEKFMVLAMKAPATNVVLAHTFGPKFAQAVMFKTMTSYPGTRRNVYLELSGITSMFAGSPFTDHIAWLCRQHGLDRVLWGSDYPLFDPAESLEGLKTYGFGGDELEQITAATASEVYSLA